MLRNRNFLVVFQDRVGGAQRAIWEKAVNRFDNHFPLPGGAWAIQSFEDIEDVAKELRTELADPEDSFLLFEITARYFFGPDAKELREWYSMNYW